MKSIYFIVFILISFQGISQIPETNIYLFNIIPTEESYTVSNPKLLTQFNDGSYNNQPLFFDANTIYFSSIPKGKEQTDIFAIDLLRKKYWQVTDTDDGEYSPTAMPSKRFFSCISQDATDNTQRLWQFPVDQSDFGKDIFPGITGVGYHAWLDWDHAAMFIVGDPIKLIVANRTTGEKRTVIESIGRGLKVNRVGRLYFIHKLSDQNWIIKRYDHKTKRIDSIIQTPGQTEDFTLLKDETIIMGSGSKLFKYNPDHDTQKEWKEVIDLTQFGIQSISRIDVLGRKLVLVTNKQ